MEDFKQRYIAARRAVIAQDLSRLNPMQRQAAMTTVITMLARLEAKGAVRHEEGGRAKRYFPAVDREDAAAAETESFLSRVYGGSLGLMMSAMVESRQLTEADIAELSAILERAGGEEHA